jgi:hypothetical protein
MSVQLKGRLEKAINCALPATLTFTYPTVHALSDFLLDQVLKIETTAAKETISTTQSKDPERPAENLADFSDDEIKDILSAELDSLSQELRE